MSPPNLTSVCMLLLIAGSGVRADDWNVDQNRLQILFRNRGNVDSEDHPSNVHRRSSYPSSRISHPIQRYGSLKDRDDPFPRYSHNEPIIIRQNTNRNNNKIYKSKEDPAAFYYNKRNVTNLPRIFSDGMELKPNSMSNSIADNQFYNERFNNTRRVDNRIRRPNVDIKSKIYPKTVKSYNRSKPETISRFSSGATNFQQNICVRCPAERTSIAAKNRERVLLEAPELIGCGGNPVPSYVRFKVLYGPKIGALLKEGTHVTVGSIVAGNETLQLCQYRSNVIVRRCPELLLSQGVVPYCLRNGAWGTTCRFKCTDPMTTIKGAIRIKCTDNITWSAKPPTCEQQNKVTHSWCEPPSLPKYGTLDCQTTSNEAPPHGVPEGTMCSFTCPGRRTNTESSTVPSLVCKAGTWDGEIPFCSKPRRRRHKLQQKSLKNKKNMHSSH